MSSVKADRMSLFDAACVDEEDTGSISTSD
jgi:hypothetical protein